MSDRPALELFFAMFPGDVGRGVPAARDTAAAARLEALLPELAEVDHLIAGAALPDDADAAVKALKALSPDLVDRFVTEAVTAYFSDPAVARALTGRPVPLFPNHTVMADIDYDLLEPVYAARGLADD
jgi:hypothetical protein